MEQIYLMSLRNSLATPPVGKSGILLHQQSYYSKIATTNESIPRCLKIQNFSLLCHTQLDLRITYKSWWFHQNPSLKIVSFVNILLLTSWSTNSFRTIVWPYSFASISSCSLPWVLNQKPSSGMSGFPKWTRLFKPCVVNTRYPPSLTKEYSFSSQLAPWLFRHMRKKW